MYFKFCGWEAWDTRIECCGLVVCIAFTGDTFDVCRFDVILVLGYFLRYSWVIVLEYLVSFFNLAC